MKAHNVLLVLFVILSFFGCSVNFKTISSVDFKKKLEESSQNSVVSWWYFGKKNNYHYLMEKWVIDKYYYKVKEEDFIITFDNKSIEFNDKKPLNLKNKNIQWYKGKK